MELPDLPVTERVIIEMTNAFRAEQKLGAVVPNATLAKAAKAFAEYLAKTDRFGHTVDGRQPADRTKEAGYKHCYIAENLAMNMDSRGFASRVLATNAVMGWKNSPPHREAMLQPHVTEIGVGIARAPSGPPKFLSVQLFGRPESLRFTFKVENLSGTDASYTFQDKPVVLPTRTTMTQTVCTPGTLSFKGVTGTFAAADGTTYRLSRGTAGALQVEVKTK